MTNRPQSGSRWPLPRLLCAVALLLCLPGASAAPPDGSAGPPATFYYYGFHIYVYGESEPTTPANIQRKFPAIPVKNPAVALQLSAWLASRGGAASFSPRITRLRVDFADGRGPVFVDDSGVVRVGASEYRLTRAAFEHVSVTVGRLRVAFLHPKEVALERARPALIRAARDDDVAAVRRLLARGAAPNVCDNSHRKVTALMGAAYNGNDALVRLLLDRGADINAEDARGLTALSYAVHEGNIATAHLLLARGESARGPGGGYALTEAIFHEGEYHRGASLIVPLLDRGADINVRDELKKTPLMNAIDERVGAVARLLIGRGADVSVVDINGSPPLHSAAETGDADLAALLLNHGADVNADPHRAGTPPLLVAVVGDKPAVVKLLLARGARVSIDGDGGLGVLQHAETVGNPAIIQMLLQACEHTRRP